jgi:hypothetical protein
MACTDPNIGKSFVQYKLNKFECLKKDGWWLEEKDINDFISTWTPDNPLVLSSVYGEFATNIEGGVITLADIEKCINNPPAFDIEPDKHIALDFAAGGDSNAIVFRNGNDVQIIKVWKERDTMLTARQMCEQLDMLRLTHYVKPGDVTGDADGLGLPIIHRMRELGWSINEFHGNGTSKDYMCKNLITDCWINACKKIRNRTLIIPNEQQLKLQLTSRKSFMGQTGKLQLESKEDMRSRGIPSPDIADAFAMACSPASSNLLTFVAAGRGTSSGNNRGYAFF